MASPVQAGEILPPPEPQSGAVQALAELLVMGGAGTVALFCLVAVSTPTLGATRSVRLRIAERDRQIETAVSGASANPIESAPQ